MPLPLPTSVTIPFQVLADDAITAAERLTLAMLYAFADEQGMVQQTPISLEKPRDLYRNSIRRHLDTLVAQNFLVPIARATKVEVVQRKHIRGYFLTLKPDGSRYSAAHRSKRIGGKWDRSDRWQ